MKDREQNITIKGTKDGLTIFINDSCALEEALGELEEMLKEHRPRKDEPDVLVTIQLGDRYLNQEKTKQLESIISEENHLRIHAIESNIISREEAFRWIEESQVKVFHQMVRSGQVLNVSGDLLLIGDVNPGGQVVSTGNVYVMGNLRGIAHAGVNGDREAVIVAGYMKPSQLRIADYMSRAPDYETTGVYMECGMIDEGEDKIIIDRLQVLTQKRKDLSTFERRINNG